MTAIRIMSKRCALCAIVPDTTTPAMPMAMYVTGSQPGPYASRNMALATMPSRAAMAPNRKDCAVSQCTAACPGGRPVLTRASSPSRRGTSREAS